MPSALPIADPAPADGLLPATVADGWGGPRVRRLRARAVLQGALRVLRLQHLHGGRDPRGEAERLRRAGARRDRAGRARARGDRRSGAAPASTVFFGGGTPTLLPVADLASLLAGIRSTWGLAPGAEVTTEANPDSVDERSLAELAAAGFTRVSFGMQSAVPHVLATLERTHDPERIPQVVAWARAAGLQVSLDLIYGTPGESAADWQASLDLAIAQQPRSHQRLRAHRRARHEAGPPDLARRGAAARRRPRRRPVRAGRRDARRRRLRLVRGQQLGSGCRRTARATTSPTGRGRTGGASAPERTATSAACAGGTSSIRPPTRSASPRGSRRPRAARPSTPETRRVETVLLGSRLADGLPIAALDDAGRTAVAALIADGLDRRARRDRGTRRADAARPAARRRRGAAADLAGLADERDRRAGTCSTRRGWPRPPR